MDDREFAERLLPRLLEIDPAEALDPNLVAAYVDGVLPEADRESVERRIARDPEAMLLVRALREDRAGGVLWPRILAVAAVLLVAIGLGWVLAGSGTSAPTLSERLVAATSDLTRRAPDLFEGFAPVVPGEGTTAAPVARGGGTWVSPVGVLLEAPEELRWQSPVGATRVEVSLSGEGVTWSSQVEGERVEAPRLAPGRYVARLRALDSLAGQEVRRVFVVVSREEAERHARAVKEISDIAPADLAVLLRAHYALSHRLYAEAEDALRSLGAATDPEVVAAAEALARHADALAAGGS